MPKVPAGFDTLTDDAFRYYNRAIIEWETYSVKSRGPKCYIAGPMRGVRYFNYPAFLGAKDALEAFDYRVLMADLTEEPNEEGHTDTPLRKFMQHDLPLLCQADCVFVLPGWEKSHGAKIEVHLAFQLDIPVYDIMTGRDIVEQAKEKSESLRKAELEVEAMNWASTPPPSEPKRHIASERVHQILREAGRMHDQKSLDYGVDGDPFKNVRNSEDFGVPAWVGASIRLNDKVKRLQTFAQKGELKYESVADSFMDLIVYAAIGLVLFEETSGA